MPRPINLLQGTGSQRSIIKFEFPPHQSLDYHDFGGGYNSRDADIEVANNELTGGQNIDLNIDKSISKRKGHTLFGNFMGPTTKVLDLITHYPPGGTQEMLSVYDTSVMRYVSGTWTALTSVTMTTNLPASHAFFPLTAKTYITNGTDNVVKYTSGTSGDQTDSSFKKGTSIVHYKNRLLTNISNQLWYTDLGVDTFSSNNYVKAAEDITGLCVLWDKLLVTSKHAVYVIQNFGFNGVAAGPESFLPLRSDFGAISGRTLVRLGNLAFFYGQDSQGISGVYATDGTSVSLISNKIYNDLNSVATGQLTNAAATAWGRYYRLSVATSSSGFNNREYLYDTVQKRWLPPYTSNGFSCYTTYETSGQLDIYAGSQIDGQVFKLNQQDYDEYDTEKYTGVTASYDAPVDANPAKRAAQSFKLSSYTLQQSVPITQVFLKIKKNTGTTTALTVRIETDNNGNPSGILANTNATTSIGTITSTSYSYVKASFSNCSLTGNTRYWIVLKHTTEGTGTSQYYWGGDSSSPTYTNGNLSLYAASSSGTLTFNPTVTAIDGYVYGNTNGAAGANSTFSTLRGVATGSFNTGLSIISVGIVQQDADATLTKFADLQRGVVLFDTSSLPDDAVISSATLSLYTTFVNNDFSQSVGVTASSPASSTALVGADYSVSNFGSTRFASDKTMDSLTLNAYNDFTLNSSGRSAISLTGVTKFALRASCDIDNTAPSLTSEGNFSSYTQFNSVESANPPRLTIVYTSAGGSNIWVSDATKDLNFATFVQGDIDGYADTKAFFLAPQGQKAHIRYIFVTAKAASSNYYAEVGINSGTFSSFDSAQFALDGTGAAWGTGVWGTMVWGGTNRAEVRVAANGFRNRTAKFRFRNRFANQPFTIYAFRTTFEVIPKIK